MSRTTRVPRLDLAVLSIDAATALSSHASTAPAAAPVAYVKKVKVILVGDAGTGKSCLVMRLATGRYPSRLPLQSGADARAIVQHDVGRERITVHWVEASSDWMRARINGEGVQPPDVFVLTYDPSRPETYHHILDQWPASLRVLSSPKVRCIVLRMKCDSDASPSECADYETASKELAEKLPRFAAHLGVSALSGEGLEQLVGLVCRPDPKTAGRALAPPAAAGGGAVQTWCSVM